jgi:HEAT repeat protein
MPKGEIHTDGGSCIEDEVSTGGGDFVGRDQISLGTQVVTRPQYEELGNYLARAVAAYEERMCQIVACPPAPPDRPYKFLYPFDIGDEAIFFGRDRAVEGLYQKLLASRLTVLHARSGAGKTSLLNAGLSPRLIRAGRLPVYARAYEDPALAIRRAIGPASLGPWPEQLSKLTMHEFLGLAGEHLSRQTQELVVILDQFEEFFIFWPERDQRQPFIDALADCYDDRGLPVRFVIGIRGDYFTHLATFQGRLPQIFHNEYYLEAMTREEAQAAITGPLAVLGRPVIYEQALLTTLLDDLARGGMELPHLQIICSWLYDEALASSETAITLAAYEGLGRAEGVLGRYLYDVLDRLPGKGGPIAVEVLKELVSSEATKRVLSYGTLAARVEAEQGELDGVLARLVDARLLRRYEVAGEINYEMAHEYLIEEINKWIDQADLGFKQAEELLRREVANWRAHRTLIPRERLELLYAQRERFRGLDEEAWECLLRSALQAGFAIGDWARLAGETAEKLLLAALSDPHEEVRRAATRSLGALWELPGVSGLGDEDHNVRRDAAVVLGELGDPRAVEPLIAALRNKDWEMLQVAVEALVKIGRPTVGPLIAALGDEDSYVRQAAAVALGAIGDPRAVEPLSAALRDGNSYVRRAAAEALGRLGGPHAVGPLIAALRDEDERIREAAAEALGRLGDPRAVGPLIAALRDEDSYVRREATEALVKIDGPAVEPLIAALRDEDERIREAAAEALGRLGDPRAVGPLIAALRDEDSDVRQAAAEALVKIGGPAVEPLSAALGDEDRDVRRVAAGALGAIGDPRAVEPLSAALRDEKWIVRQAAAGALGTIGDPRAVEPLSAALRDKEWTVRRAAAGALGTIGDPRAVGPLSAALRDEKWIVRQVAAGALGTIGDSRAVEWLSAALRDKDSDVRQAAAEALEAIGDPRAVEPLTAALGDEDSDVCGAAAEALKKIGTPEALAALERAEVKARSSSCQIE